jgi:hypothetical protein
MFKFENYSYIKNIKFSKIIFIKFWNFRLKNILVFRERKKEKAEKKNEKEKTIEKNWYKMLGRAKPPA